MVDAKDAAQESRWRDEPARFRWKIPRAVVAKGPVGLETLQVRRADLSGYPIQLRAMPGNRKHDGRVENNAVIQATLSLLPRTPPPHQHPPTQLLFPSRFEPITFTP